MQKLYLENGFVYYYGNRVGYQKGELVYVDSIFHTRHLKQWLKEEYGLYTRSQEGLYQRLRNCMVYGTDGKAHVRFCRIWQWREEVPPEKKFLSYKAYTRAFGPVNLAEYQVVYDGYSETDVPEAIFQKFHTGIPDGFPGHAVSMSDVIELYGADACSSFYYVDEFGFVVIEGGMEYEKGAGKTDDCHLGQSRFGEEYNSSEAGDGLSEGETADRYCVCRFTDPDDSLPDR